MICQIHRNSISNHLITIINIIINKFIIIRECLDSCNLSNCHTSIQMFISFNEFL